MTERVHALTCCPSNFRRSLFLFLCLAMSAVPLAAGRAAPADGALPDGFVRLSDVAPQIAQDMRYAGDHNFVGRPIVGYEAPECLLTEAAAIALAGVADELASQGLGLRVYDCYRPARAVADFAAWARDVDDVAMRGEFYPRIDKARLFDLGYIAERSRHSRGSTVDLTVMRLGGAPVATWRAGDPLADCALPQVERFAEGSLDFGTGYDCFDIRAHHGAAGIPEHATAHRRMLADVMARHGFKLYQEEWWHYTLVDEPFPETYFDFPVAAGR